MDVEEQHRTVFAADRRQFTRLGNKISIRCLAVGDVDDDRRKSVRMLLTPRLGNLGCLLERGAHRSAPFPVWFDPYWKGGTPMCAALKEATKIAETWCQEHPNGFPPIVINITDGEATDGDLVAEARKLTAVSGEDGSVLLFNIHLSSTAGPSIELPGNGNKLPDKHAKQLFEASSTLTPFMVARATELGMPAEENSRGFIFNAQPLHVIHFLDIGTRPANVHLR